MSDKEFVIAIRSATYMSDYKIRLEFSDGKIQAVDFEPFLRSSKLPGLDRYLDKAEFQKFSLIDGDINWNDFDMVFPIADLYDNSLMKASSSDSEAS